jgi:ATP-dependent DNA ligase
MFPQDLVTHTALFTAVIEQNAKQYIDEILLLAGQYHDYDELPASYEGLMQFTPMVSRPRRGTKGFKMLYWLGCTIQHPETDDAYRFAVSYTRNEKNNRVSLKVSAPTQAKSKNVGKANQTTPFEQALIDIGGVLAKKRLEGFNEQGLLLWRPMLAETLRADRPKTEAKLLKLIEKFGAVCQPKWDGLRCNVTIKIDPQTGIATVAFPQSRYGVIFPGAASSTSLLRSLTDLAGAIYLHTNELEMTLDGELMLPEPHAGTWVRRRDNGAEPSGSYIFQATQGCAKAIHPESEHLYFRWYDVAFPNNTEADYKERYMDIAPKISYEFDAWSQTHEVSAMSDIYALVQQFTKQGLEGAMVRILGQPYAIAERSTALWKCKDGLRESAEFELIGMTPSETGVTKGCAILMLKTEDGTVFEAKPSVSHAQARFLMNNFAPELDAGKMWTVEFEGYTNSGAPRNPIAIAERSPDE